MGLKVTPRRRAATPRNANPRLLGGGRGLGNVQRRLAEIGGSAVLENAEPGLRVRLVLSVAPQDLGD